MLSNVVSCVSGGFFFFLRGCSSTSWIVSVGRTIGDPGRELKIQKRQGTRGKLIYLQTCLICLAMSLGLMEGRVHLSHTWTFCICSNLPKRHIPSNKLQFVSCQSFWVAGCIVAQ